MDAALKGAGDVELQGAKKTAGGRTAMMDRKIEEEGDERVDDRTGMKG